MDVEQDTQNLPLQDFALNYELHSQTDFPIDQGTEIW